MITKEIQSGLRAVLFVAGCVLFGYVFIRLHPTEVLSLLSRIGWHFGLVAAIYSGYELIRTIALGRCITTSQRPTFWNLLKIRLYGEAIQFLTFTGPFLAEPGKAWFLRSRGLTTAHALAATISETLVYTLTSAAMSVAGLVYLLHGLKLTLPASIVARAVLYAMSAFLLVSAYALARRIYLIGAIVQGIARLPLIGRRLGINVAEVRHMEDLLFVILRDHPRRFLLIVGLELTAQALLVLELVVILRASGVSFSPLDPLLIESATKFIGVGFFFIPMQVGVAEGAYALIFNALGLAASIGFTVALVRRLRSLLAAGSGLASALLSRSRRLD